MMKHILLTRDAFREMVFLRDKGKCVFCDKPAVDAHHILERRLWSDGGYYLNNGASVCAEHHIQCETTNISVEDVRIACGITKPVIPEHLYDDIIYDKWGNPCMENGFRSKGELFFDESVQKILKQGGALDLFTNKCKYSRTYHLPWSESVNKDDRVLKNTSIYTGKRVIISEKMDGENTSLYREYTHARSLDSRNHPSRNWIKNFWSTIAMDIPEDWRICGENMFAEHSISYHDLKSYFYGFSIWNEANVCLSFDETTEWFDMLGITAPDVWYDDIYNEEKIKSIWKNKNPQQTEGYVLRIADSFHYKDFKTSVAKFVRKNHVQTTKHWMHGQPIKQNKLL